MSGVIVQFKGHNDTRKKYEIEDGMTHTHIHERTLTHSHTHTHTHTHTARTQAHIQTHTQLSAGEYCRK